MHSVSDSTSNVNVLLYIILFCLFIFCVILVCVYISLNNDGHLFLGHNLQQQQQQERTIFQNFIFFGFASQKP